MKGEINDKKKSFFLTLHLRTASYLGVSKDIRRYK